MQAEDTQKKLDRGRSRFEGVRPARALGSKLYYARVSFVSVLPNATSSSPTHFDW
jgi:hypothetical protein